MGEAKRKAEAAPDVSVLLPSRKRPESLLRAIRSLMGDGDANIEILVGLDDDDIESRNLPEIAGVQYIVGPRPKTLGSLFNSLAAKSRGKWIMGFTDDIVMAEPDWVQRILNTGEVLPRKIGLLYLKDDSHQGFPSLPVISRFTYKAVGYYSSGKFPFWFDDTWWDEIAEFFGQKVEVPAAVAQPDGRGKTHGLTDLAFWVDFFEATRPQRLRDAIILLKQAYDETGPVFKNIMAQLPQKERNCIQKVAHLHSPQLHQHYESQADSKPGPHYAEVKAEAEELVKKLRESRPRRLKIAVCTPSGRSWEAGTATDIAGLVGYSALAGIEVGILNYQSSMITNARNGTVEIALKEGFDYLMWIDSDMRIPPDTLVRLLKHQKDVVGATYNKRVPPYETLGRLKGPAPADGRLAPGLHEALLLPGGVLLVKADVYRKLGYPWYWEAYKWPAPDGLGSFKELLRNYFWQVPSEEILASLDGTALADWVQENYRLGEMGEDHQFFSEDLAFCRKARRHGIELWCDISLTWEVKHIGVLEVTCLPPEKKQAAA